MLTSFYVAGLALALVLLASLHRRLSALPGRVWSLVRNERDAEAPKALDAMKEAVAAKAGASIVAIRQYEEGIAASFRAQVAEAEMRARLGERRADEAHAALQAALSLVRELRAALDGLHGPRALQLPPPVPPRLEEHESAERETTESALPPSVAGDDEPDDEHTRVAERPADLTSSLRPCIPPPSKGAESRRSSGRGCSS
jgi:hypothetical protein